MTLGKEEWERLLAKAMGEVQKAVAAVAAGPDRGLVVGKGAAGDKTLLADRRAEEILSEALLGVDGVRVLSEEAGDIGDPAGRTVAVVDPLDGSSNFERGIQFYCTSVAVAEGGWLDDVRVAMVRNLVNGDSYFAARGGGATKNGRGISTTRTRRLEDAVVAVDMSGTSGPAVKALAPLVSGAKRVVHFGANALELCYLAEGRIDAFIDVRRRMRVTDFAAGGPIAAEAGAVLTDEWGRELKWRLDLKERAPCVASANAALHRQILRLLAPSR